MPKCKGCGKEIAWVIMDTGKRMPVDIDSKEKRVCMTGVNRGVVRTTYMPHWATCEKADQFKKEK